MRSVIAGQSPITSEVAALLPFLYATGAIARLYTKEEIRAYKQLPREEQAKIEKWLADLMATDPAACALGEAVGAVGKEDLIRTGLAIGVIVAATA